MRRIELPGHMMGRAGTIGWVIVFTSLMADLTMYMLVATSRFPKERMYNIPQAT